MTEKSLEIIIQEAKERHAKKIARKKRVKIGEGYHFFVYTASGCGCKTHKVYFRKISSAKKWIEKHPDTTIIYDLNEIPIWVYQPEKTPIWMTYEQFMEEKHGKI